MQLIFNITFNPTGWDGTPQTQDDRDSVAELIKQAVAGHLDTSRWGTIADLSVFPVGTVSADILSRVRRKQTR